MGSQKSKIDFRPPKFEINNYFLSLDKNVIKNNTIIPEIKELHFVKSKHTVIPLFFYNYNKEAPTIIISHSESSDIFQYENFCSLIVEEIRCNVIVYDYSGFSCSIVSNTRGAIKFSDILEGIKVGNKYAPTYDMSNYNTLSVCEYAKIKLALNMDKLVLFGVSFGVSQSLYLCNHLKSLNKTPIALILEETFLFLFLLITYKS